MIAMYEKGIDFPIYKFESCTIKVVKDFYVEYDFINGIDCDGNEVIKASVPTSKKILIKESI